MGLHFSSNLNTEGKTQQVSLIMYGGYRLEYAVLVEQLSNNLNTRSR